MTAPPLSGEQATSLPLVAAGQSHPGMQRDQNEDAFGSFVENRLFIVADGMGGHNAGEVAAAMAIDTVEGFFTSFHSDPRQVWPYGVDRALSRAARPEMTDEELAGFAHRNVVMRSLGSKDDLEPDVYVNKAAAGDLYLLCTDGLWGSVRDARIADILRSTSDVEAACQLLIDAANEAGGPDNITVLLVRLG